MRSTFVHHLLLGVTLLLIVFTLAGLIGTSYARDDHQSPTSPATNGPAAHDDHLPQGVAGFRSITSPAPALSVVKTRQAQLSPAQTFNQRPLRIKATRWMTVTAYCAGACCCGKSDGITASGKHVSTHGMKLVAGPRDMRFGTILSIPGYHQARPVPVLDRGGKIKGDRLDVLMPTHTQAKKWGVKRLKVTVWEYAD